MSSRSEDGDLTAVHQRFASTRCPDAHGTLIEAYTPIARSLARRYYRGKEPLEDLEQVAIEGLLRALERFDLGCGVPFLGFATPYIVGTIKRHYRDSGWAVSVPRWVHDLAPQLNRAREDLAQRLQADPSVDELSAYLGVPVDRIEQAAQGVVARAVDSLDHPTLHDPSGAVDREIDLTDTRVQVQRALDRLRVTDRAVIQMYFQDGMTQEEIGMRVGVSQAQVSRRLTQSIEILRDELTPASA